MSRGAFLERAERPIVRIESTLLALLPFALAGLGLGTGIWWRWHEQHRAYFLSNKLSTELRVQALYYPLLCACLLPAVALGVAWYRASRQGLSAGELILLYRRRWEPALWVLASLPLFAFISAPRTEDKTPGFLSFVIVLSGLAAAMAGLRAVECWALPVRWLERLKGRRLVRLGRWLSVLIVLGGVAYYVSKLSHLSIALHRNLGSHMDLAVYENVLWNTAHGNFLGCSICAGKTHASSHFDPFLALFALAYRWLPTTETLLVGQSVWLALGAIPAYLLARKWVGSLAASLCYLLAPALHGANLFGFHSLALCMPLALAAVCALDYGYSKLYWLSLLLLLTVREDMALVGCCLGLYCYLLRRRWLGLATVGVSLSYLVLVKSVFMADSQLIMKGSSSTVSFAHYFRSMMPHPEEGARGLIVSLLTNPVHAVRVALLEGKLRYFALLLGPVLGICLAAPRRLVLATWGGIFVGLASRGPVFSTHFQYSALLLPGIYAALPLGLVWLAGRWLRAREPQAEESSRARRARVVALAFGCLVASVGFAWKFGALHENTSLRGGWARPSWATHLEGSPRYRALKPLLAQIPKDASVSATRGLLSYVAGREELSKHLDRTEYILVDHKRMAKNRKQALARARAQWHLKKLGSSHGITLYQRTSRKKDR